MAYWKSVEFFCGTYLVQKRIERRIGDSVPLTRVSPRTHVTVIDVLYNWRHVDLENRKPHMTYSQKKTGIIIQIFFSICFVIHKRLTCPRFFFKNIKMEAVRKFLIEVHSLPEPYWKQQFPWNRTWCRKSPIPTHWLYLELKNILTKRKILIMNLQQCHYGRQNQRINAN